VTDEEAGYFLLLMSVAGNETVRTATSHAIRLLSEHPDQRELLAGDVNRYIEPAIEEVLRFASPVNALRRTATCPTAIGSQGIQTGDKVVMSLPSALRDERTFEHADRFDITRTPSVHQIAFGHGEHYCLGANLARVQLKAILSEIYTRIPDIHLVGKPTYQRTTFLAGVLNMSVAFTPEAGRG
jgi:cytochrome P450